MGKEKLLRLPKITIHNLVDGDSVSYRQTITGYVHPVQRVQVLIYSADDKWYLQKEAVVNSRGQWSADCTFGYWYSLHDFSVTAVASSPLEPSPVTEIPADLMRSRTVVVNRNFFSGNRP